MSALAQLERRLSNAQRQPRERARAHSETHRRRNAVARFEQERAAALTDPSCSPVKRARLTFEGAGISTQALAIMAGVSRHTISKAERGDPVSAATLRRLASALNVRVADIVAKRDRDGG